MSVSLTKRAEQDIIDLYAYGAGQFGIERAERYHTGLLVMFDLLASNPHLARLRAEFAPPVRLHAYQAHMIVYVEHGNGIMIVRVLHGKQDWQKALT